MGEGVVLSESMKMLHSLTPSLYGFMCKNLNLLVSIE